MYRTKNISNSPENIVTKMKIHVIKQELWRKIILGIRFVTPTYGVLIYHFDMYLLMYLKSETSDLLMLMLFAL